MGKNIIVTRDEANDNTRGIGSLLRTPAAFGSTIEHRRINVKHFGLVGVAVLLAIATYGRGDGPKQGAKEAEADSKAMRGTWLPESAVLGGNPFPDEVRKSIRLVLSDGKYTVTVGDQPDEGTTTIDASKKPKHLDIVGTKGPNKGKTFYAIYELNGDTLKVCYDLSGTGRPTEFKSKEGTQLFLATYRREKR